MLADLWSCDAHESPEKKMLHIIKVFTFYFFLPASRIKIKISHYMQFYESQQTWCKLFPAATAWVWQNRLEKHLDGNKFSLKSGSNQLLSKRDKRRKIRKLEVQNVSFHCCNSINSIWVKVPIRSADKAGSKILNLWKCFWLKQRENIHV